MKELEKNELIKVEGGIAIELVFLGICAASLFWGYLLEKPVPVKEVPPRLPSDDNLV